MDIRAIDLFCGVGGLTHGFSRAGINVTAGVDIDPSCKFPIESNNSTAFIERDIRDFSSSEASDLVAGGDVSVLAGCAPCQPFSTYSRSGRSGKRPEDWRLAGEFGRLVADVQPDLVAMENVPQLADHMIFRDFLDMLAGYSITWRIIDTARVGVPQTRKRLVLLASKLGSARLDVEDDPLATATVRSTIGTLPPLNAGGTSESDPLHTASRLSPLNFRRIQQSKPGGTWRDWDEELQADCHRKVSGATYPSVYGRMEWDKPAPTITTQSFGYGNGRFGHPEQDRAISLREAAMLQTFPEDYGFVPSGEVARFNVLGRLIGNAVPVKLAEAMGSALHSHAQHYSDVIRSQADIAA